MLPDEEAPTTSVLFEGGKSYRDPSGQLFVSSDAHFSVSARDPPVGPVPGTGVSGGEARLDSGTFATFQSAAPPPGTFPQSLGAGAHSAQYRSYDFAGNTETLKASSFRVDATPPTVDFAASTTTRIWNDIIVINAPGGIPYVARLEDSGGAGAESGTFTLDGGAPFSEGPAFTILASSGLHTLTISAQDRVGNALDRTTNPYRVIIGDSRPPRSSISFLEGSATPNEDSYPSTGSGVVFVRNNARVRMTSSEDLLEVGDAQGLGAVHQEAAGAQQYLRVDGPPQGPGQTMASDFAISAPYETEYTLDYSARDAFGNAESVKSLPIIFDNTPPTLTFSAGYAPKIDALGRIVLSGGTAISISGEDPPYRHSGIDEIYYSIDGGPAVHAHAGLLPVNVPEGDHLVQYWAADRVGNRTSTTTKHLVVDSFAPAVGDILLLPLGSTAYASSQVPLSTNVAAARVSVRDLASGLAVALANNIPHQLSVVPNTLGLWHFDESSGGSTADSANVAGPGTINSNVSRITGVLGKGVRVSPPNFPRNNAGVTLPQSAASVINNLTAATVELWARFDQFASGSQILTIKQWNGYNTMFEFGLAPPPHRQFWHATNAFGECVSDFEPTPGRWYHLATTWDATKQVLYVDGAPQGTCGGTSLPNAGSSCISIAGPCGDLAVSGGGITAFDEVRIVSRVLTPSEIAADAVAPLSMVSARISNNGGLSFVQVSSVSLSGQDGTTDEQFLHIGGFQLSASTGPGDWRNTFEIRARDLAGHEAVERRPVYLDTNPNYPLTALTPDDGAMVSTSGLLSWALDSHVPAAAIERFEVILSSSADFSSIALSITSSENGLHLPKIPDGAYWWKARAISNFNSASPYSVPRRVLFDGTPPTIAISSPASGHSFLSLAERVTAQFLLHDTFDVSPDSSAYLVLREDRGTPIGTNPSSIPASSGQSWGLRDLDDGVWELHVEATDHAGNHAATDGGSFAILHDLTEPRSTFTAIGMLPATEESSPSSDAVFVRNGAQFYVSSVDDLLAPGDAQGSGVATQDIYFNGSLASRHESEPVPGSAITSTLTVSGIPDGIYPVVLYVEDGWGNRESVQLATVAVDNTPPLTLLAGSSKTDALGRLVLSSGSATLNASDPPVGGVASGVGDLAFSIDGGSEHHVSASSAPIELPEGVHDVKFWSSDRLGNRGPEDSRRVVVDNTPPSFGALLARSGNISFFSYTDVPISSTTAVAQIALQDLVSGLDVTSLISRPRALTVIPGTLGLWGFDETTGNVAHDAASYAGDGTLNQDTVRVPGIVGGAVSVAPGGVSRPDAGVTLPSSAFTKINSLATGTIEMWLKIPVPAPNGKYTTLTVKQRDGYNTMFWFGITPPPNQQFWHPGNFLAQCYAPISMDPTRWYHVAATWDATSEKLYVDGELKATCVLSAVVPNSPSATCLSIAGPCGDTVIGSGGVAVYDEVRVLNHAMSQAELASDSSLVQALVQTRISTDGGTTFSYTPSVSLTGSDGSVDPQTLTVDGLDLSPSISPDDGRNILEFHARDLAGNEATERRTILVNLNPQFANIPESPLDGTVLATSAPEFRWSLDGHVPSASISAFELQTATSASFETVAFSTTSAQGAATAPSMADGTYYWRVRSLDKFGGTSPFSPPRKFSLDTAPPSVSILAPLAGTRFYARASTVTVSFSVADAFDYAPSSHAVLIERRDMGTPLGSRPSAYEVRNGQTLLPADLDDGFWELVVSATDSVANSTASFGGPFEVVHDILGPRSFLTAGSPQADGGPNGALFVAARTTFTLESYDDLLTVGDFLGLGVSSQVAYADGVSYLTATDSSPAIGKSLETKFHLINLGQGPHEVAFAGWDALANAGPSGSRQVVLDDLPPATTLVVSTPAYNGFVSPRTVFSLNATDPGEHPSGLAEIRYSVDSSSWTSFSSAFSLGQAEGPRSVSFQAFDRLLNAEQPQTRGYLLDARPPEASVVIIGGQTASGPEPGSFYASAATRFSLAATDPAVEFQASGVGRLEWSIDSGAFEVFRSTLQLAEGTHLIRYKSTDRVQNEEPALSTRPYIDATPPLSALSIGSPSLTLGATMFVTPATTMTFTGSDPEKAGVASGLGYVEGDTGAGWSVRNSPIALAEGVHPTYYRSVDRVGNMEPVRSLRIESDGTPPATALLPGSPAYRSGERSYAPASTIYSLSALDPEVNGVAVGVDSSFYRVDSAAFVVLDGTFTLDAGVRQVEFFSRDHLLNTELAHGTTLYVDGTPPVSVISIGVPRADLGGDVFISTSSLIGVTASDPDPLGSASGVAAIETSIDGGDFRASSTSFVLAEGSRVLAFRSRDNVGNVEQTRSTNVVVDANAPVFEALSPGSGARFVPGQQITIHIQASDDHDPTPGVRARLVRLEDRGIPRAAAADVVVKDRDSLSPLDLDDGLWELRVDALDFVGNASSAAAGEFEVVHDTLPPRSVLTIGTPRAERDAVVYITSRTVLTATSSDDLVEPGDSAGLGVAEQRVDLDGALYAWFASTSAVMTSTFAVAGPDAVRALSFGAVDVLGHEEALQTVEVGVDNSPPLMSSTFSRAAVILPPAGEPWFPEDVSIIWSAEDAGSGLAVVSTPTLVQSEGRSLASVGRSADALGNGSDLTVLFNLDKTPPVVSAGADIETTEGSTVTFAGSVSDNLDPEPRFSWLPGPSAYYPDDGTFRAVIVSTDHAGHVASSSTTIRVRNVPPRVSAGGARTLTEGAPILLQASFFDPGVLDVHHAAVDWGDGTVSAMSVAEASGSGEATASHAYGDEGTYVATVSVGDDDDVGIASFTVTVLNAPPIVSALPDVAVGEGVFIELPPASFTDAGYLDTHTAAIDWGDGTSEPASDIVLARTPGSEATATSGTIQASHAYGDNGTFTAVVTVTDDDGGTSSSTFKVTVANQAPALAALPDLAAQEGAFIQLPPASFTDAGYLDTHTAAIDWGDGTSEPASDIVLARTPGSEATATSGTIQASHAYGDNGTFTVVVAVTDDDGASSSSTFMVTVANQAPALAAMPDLSTQEGSFIQLPPASFTDAGYLDTHTAAIDWGDGTLEPAADITLAKTPGGEGTATSGTIQASHAYGDNGTFTAVVTVTDDDGASSSSTFKVTVANQAPALAAMPDLSTQEGAFIQLPPASFTDAGYLDTHTAAIDWGDGTLEPAADITLAKTPGGEGTATSGTIQASHAYGDNGTFTAVVTVTDDDGASSSSTFKVTVANQAPALAALPDVTTKEGDFIQLPPASFADAGYLDTHTASIDWGDGTTEPTADITLVRTAGGEGTPTSGTIQARHAYADDGIYAAVVSVADDDGSVSRSSFKVTTLNVPPSVGALPDALSGAGAAVLLGGQIPIRTIQAYAHEGDSTLTTYPVGPETIQTFAPAVYSDPGFDNTPGGTKEDFTAVVDWGDGRTSGPADVLVDETPGQEGTPSSGKAYGTGHQYAVSGKYDVKITLSDDDGGAGISSFTVKADRDPPQTTATYIGSYVLPANAAGAAPPDVDVFLRSDSRVSLAAQDPIVGDVTSGVQRTFWREGLAAAFNLYSAPFRISGPGVHTLEFFSVDERGNEESHKVLRVGIDDTAPVNAIAYGSTTVYAFNLPILLPDTSVTLSAADPLVAGVMVGLDRITYSLDGGPETEYTSAITVPVQGTHRLEFGGYDRLGTSSRTVVRFAVSVFHTGTLSGVFGVNGSGTADVSGPLLSNGHVDLGGSVSIAGDVTAATVTLKGQAQVSGAILQGESPLDPEPIDLDLIADLASAASSNALIPAEFIVNGALALGSGRSLTLTTGSYVLSGLKIDGGASLAIIGHVDILVDGPLDVSGGGALNSGGTADSLNVYLSSNSGVTLTGGAMVAAIVYSPRGEVKVAGNARVAGALAGRTATVTGTGNVLTNATSLPPAQGASSSSGGSSKGGKGGKLASASLDGAGPTAGADASFALRDLYVFPNPAVDGARPTIHMAVGVADKVTIRIYDVSGQPVHEATLDTPPPVINDGSGPNFAYEHAWDGHIPSGVYLYTIVAEKAGQAPVRKAGKFSVVR